MPALKKRCLQLCIKNNGTSSGMRLLLAVKFPSLASQKQWRRPGRLVSGNKIRRGIDNPHAKSYWLVAVGCCNSDIWGLTSTDQRIDLPHSFFNRLKNPTLPSQFPDVLSSHEVYASQHHSPGVPSAHISHTPSGGNMLHVIIIHFHTDLPNRGRGLHNDHWSFARVILPDDDIATLTLS